MTHSSLRTSFDSYTPNTLSTKVLEGHLGQEEAQLYGLEGACTKISPGILGTTGA